jgi:nucleoside-diphosphate-sugar epimerase
MNFCSQDDAAMALVAAMDRGRNGAVYHATDALPMRRREVVRYVASRLGIPAREAAGAGDLGGPDRRILGLRTRAELQLVLQWPSLKDGLEPLLAKV